MRGAPGMIGLMPRAAGDREMSCSNRHSANAFPKLDHVAGLAAAKPLRSCMWLTVAVQALVASGACSCSVLAHCRSCSSYSAVGVVGVAGKQPMLSGHKTLWCWQRLQVRRGSDTSMWPSMPTKSTTSAAPFDSPAGLGCCKLAAPSQNGHHCEAAATRRCHVSASA